jgi:tRNA nucleotidyltransferase (CCA-adding enzyme)
VAGGIPSLSRLPQATRAMLAAARALAGRRGGRLYLAGGAVRDLLLRRPIRDVDLVLDGDAVGFAEILAARLKATCRIHHRFGTAILTLPDGRRLDLAATRRETYAHSGALPAVSLGASIEDDLARRDFTVNAMAMEIAPARRLVDPFGGRADLARGILRALHAKSFCDDPTRALRAVRYGQRLGFRLAPEARRAIAQAVRDGAFDAVSGQRLAREIALLFSEEGRGGAVEKLRRLGVDGAITPVLARPRSAPARVASAEALSRSRALPVTWLCYLLTWMGTEEASPRVAERLALAGREGGRVRAWPATLRRLTEEPALAATAGRGDRVRGLSLDEVVAAAACSGRAVRRALLASLAAPPVALAIRGADLVAAGIPSGPAIGAALAQTLAAREDGRIARAQELAFAIRAARQRLEQVR